MSFHIWNFKKTRYHTKSFKHVIGDDIEYMYFHKFCPNGVISKYSLIVFDESNEIFYPLTNYYYYQESNLSKNTLASYLHYLEKFFSWLEKSYIPTEKIIRWDFEPALICEAIERYLNKVLDCKLKEREGYNLVYISQKSPKTVSLFLSSIKSFYRWAIKYKEYKYMNPLLQLSSPSNRNYLEGQRNNKPRMPPIAGTEKPIQLHRKFTDSYFKIVNEVWKPEIIGDSELPYKIYKAGAELKWRLRDEVIIRLMFETGARITEIIELTFGDYNKRRDLYEMATFNKGSNGKRTKYIRFSRDTLKLLGRYLRKERNIKKIEDQPSHVPLFVTDKQTQYSYKAFYYHWSSITRHAQIKMNPHKARHWFVTSMLRTIFETSINSSEIEKRKQELIKYMSWKDASILNIYEHYFDEEKYRDIHNMLTNNMNKYEEEYRLKLKLQVDEKIEQNQLNNKKNDYTKETWIVNFFDGME